jgi:tRNA isopentenyl-2-thiomethyl-A-37 hydroxylase MiaE
MTNQSQVYSFGLRLRDKEFNVSGDRDFVESYVERWLQLFGEELPETLQPNRIPTRSGGNTAEAPVARKLPTLEEFIKTKEPKTISDAILVTGLYLERFQQKNLFNRTDLMQALFSRLNKSEEDVQVQLDELVSQQFLSQSSTMGSALPVYSLTFSGEQAVKDGFNHG